MFNTEDSNNHDIVESGEFYECTVCGKKSTDENKFDLTTCNDGI